MWRPRVYWAGESVAYADLDPDDYVQAGVTVTGVTRFDYHGSEGSAQIGVTGHSDVLKGEEVLDALTPGAATDYVSAGDTFWRVGASPVTGTLRGRSATRLEPTATATRAEIATIFLRFCMLMNL